MASRTMRWTPRTAIHEMGSKDDTMMDTKDGKVNETELTSHASTTDLAAPSAGMFSRPRPQTCHPAVENGPMKQMKTKGI